MQVIDAVARPEPVVTVAAGAAPSRASMTHHPSRWAEPRRVGILLGWTALVLPFVLELVAILRANHLALVRRLPDDAFYYLEIAARVGRGEGFTFDGIHSTNGFHPLWQVLLVPVVTVLGPGSDAAVRGVLVVGLACSLAAVVLVVRLVGRITGPGPALAGGIVATQFALSPASQYTPSRWVNGMEGPVVMLALAMLATAMARADREPTRGRILTVGLLSAVLVLARLDLAPILAVVAAALAFRWRSGRRLRTWLLGAAVIGLPAAFWWLASWGHVLSTSATVKNATLSRVYAERYGGRFSWGYLGLLLDVGRDYIDSLTVWSGLTDRSLMVRASGSLELLASLCGLVLLVLAVLGGASAVRRAIRGRTSRPRVPWSADGWAVGVLVVAVTTKAMLDIASAPLWAVQWYSAPQRLMVGLVVGVGVGLGVRAVAEWSRPVAFASVVLLAALALPVNAFAWRDDVHPGHNEYWQDQIDLAADWIDAHGQVGRYGAADAGLLGHRLDGRAPVVNLDGLVNDYSFAELVGEGAPLVARVRATDVEYLVGRLDAATLADFAGCATVLWDSPERVPYMDSLTGYTRVPVRVLDVRACSA